MTKPKGNIEAIYGLSPMQEGILFHIVHAPESGLYFEQYSCRLDGALDTTTFERAWQLVIDRHPALRTLFTWEGRPRPLQIVRHEVSPPWIHEDWRGLTAAEQDSRLTRYLERDRAQGFALDAAPLLRLALFRVADDATRFVWSFHHLLLDGWSMRLVLDEALRTYEILRDGGIPPPSRARPYREYIAWLQEQDTSASQGFWTRRLAGFTEPTPLPGLSTPRLSPWAEHHLTEEIQVDSETTTELRDLARRHRLTLNTLVRGAWALLLSRYVDENDIVFGATVSGRPADLSGIQEMVGLFINTLPVRVDTSPDQSLVPWLETIQRERIEATAFDITPLVDVQRWSEVTGRPLFQSLLVFENLPGESSHDDAGHGLRVRDARYVEQSNFPLAVLAVPGPELRFIFVYDRDRYEASTIRQLAGHLRNLLVSMLEGKDGSIGDLSMLSAAEQEELLVCWNDTITPFPEDACIHHLIEGQARQAPDAIAVVFEERTCSYRELDQRAGDVARRLRERGIGAGDRVGIALGRSLEMVVGIVGILKAGGAYVPLDPEQPGDRIDFMLENAGTRAIVTSATVAPVLPRFDLPIVIVDASTTITLADPIEDDASPDDLAYVIYTSGSTGEPKGVEITHRNLVQSTTARFHYYPDPARRYCLLSPHVFDSSVAGIFWTLCQGGTLVLPSPRMEQDVTALEELIARERVTHLLALPTLYGLLLHHAAPANLESLTTVIVAGEACSADVVRRHVQQLPDTALHNEYGPTEATVWCTAHRIAPSGDSSHIPIGRPIANTRIYILDSRRAPVPIGAPGELFIGGPGLARGYVNRPELTAERFVQPILPSVGEIRLYRTGDRARFLPDGTIEFLGRIDHQVKVRGHRIELGEIETVLKGHPAVRDAVVVLESPSPPDDIDSLLDRLHSLGEDQRIRLLDEIDTLSPQAVEDLLERER